MLEPIQSAAQWAAGKRRLDGVYTTVSSSPLSRTKKEAALLGGLFFGAKIEKKHESVQSASRHIVPMALKSALLRSNFCGRALFDLETV